MPSLRKLKKVYNQASDSGDTLEIDKELFLVPIYSATIFIYLLFSFIYSIIILYII